MKRTLITAILLLPLLAWAQPAGHFASPTSPRKAMPLHGPKNGCQWEMSRFYTDDYYQICNFSYDADHRLWAMSDSIRGEYQVIDSMSYDAAGNLVRLSGWQKLGGVWQNVYYIDYTYNAAGLITSRSNYNNFGGNWELGGVYNYTYNSQNQLVLTTLNMAGMMYQKTEYQYVGNDCVQELWYSYDFDTGTLLPSEKYVTSYVDGHKVLVLDSVNDDGTHWMYNGQYTYLYDNSGNCTEYHHYDGTNNEVERSLYTYAPAMPLSSTLIPWNPEMDRPRMYDNVDACVREAWYSLDVDHVLQYVCDYVYDYNDITTSVQNRVDQEVSLYPNPASGRIVLDGLQDGEAEVSIHDLSGRLVLTRRASGPTALLDVTALAPGCYVVKVAQENEEKVVKVVVE
ncbi:MAG: T9SS type A sorting domain-containing protein [Bacteroidales bacterium]|nr:T9SS type A sorting domain-containing protein [Bacteroidales bacterium]